MFSNAALHWMRRPATAIAGVWRALKPGGRFVGEMGGHGNVQRIKTALVAALDRRGLDGQAAVPWYFPTPEEYRSCWRRTGFRVRAIDLFPRPTPLPGDIVAWLETFAESFTRRVPAAERAGYLSEVAAALRPRSVRRRGRLVGRLCEAAVRRRQAGLRPRPCAARFG